MLSSFLIDFFNQFLGNARFRIRFVVVLAAMVALQAGQVFAGNSNSLMEISQDGKLLACSNRDSGTVTIINLKTNKKQVEIKVGKHPEGVSFIGASHQLAVAVYDDDCVVFIDADAGKKIGAVKLFDEPYGIVSTRSGDKIYVTLDYPGQIVEIDVSAQKVLRTFSRKAFLRGIAISHDGRSLLTSQYLSGEVDRIDIATGKSTDFWKGSPNDNLARQLVLHPTRPKIYLPHIRSRVTVAHGAGSIFPLISVLDTRKDADNRRARIPMDSFAGTLVTSNPWEVAISPDGKTLIVVFAGTNDLFSCNVLNDDYRELTYRSYRRLGNNPRAVTFSKDGKHFYVYNALDFKVAVFNAKNLREITSIAVSKNPLGREILLGKKLFYTALPPMSSRKWIACSSCHPDGQPDGKTWHNPEGLRNTQSLAGMAWTHPIHWSADRDEVQDFEHTIEGPLMQGRGFLRGRLHPSLSKKKNAGLSQSLDAMAAYSNSHGFPISPYAKNGLSQAALRGQKLFHSEKTKCATCHSGAFYTDSNPKFSKTPSQFQMHDVGTGKDDASEKMGSKYDTPTLLGVYRTAPYLHHGKAKTLEEVLTTQNLGDKHGTTSNLSKQEMTDLVAFLKALPFEDPKPEAIRSRLVKIKK